MEFWAKVIVIATCVQVFFLILTIRTYRFKEAVDKAIADSKVRRAQETADAALSSSFGIALEVAGIAAVWPANGMGLAAFGDLVADWIVETGRQGLSLAELKECVERGDHKGYARKPEGER